MLVQYSRLVITAVTAMESSAMWAMVVQNLLFWIEMRDNMKKQLCIDTVRQFGSRFNNAILHSDRGSQYTSEAFRNELKKRGIIQSLSGAGRCYDNARMESFFETLKKEKIYKIPTYRMTREEVKTIIFRYIFGYYNRVLIYTSNPEGLPPAIYREKYKSKRKRHNHA